MFHPIHMWRIRVLLIVGADSFMLEERSQRIVRVQEWRNHYGFQISHYVSVLLSDIRDQVAVGLTTQDLPDSVIEKNVFLRAAELEVIQRITAAQYDAKLAIQSSRERITIAIQKRTAALIIPALPQIVENSALQERVRFLEVDWQARIELLQQEADDIIKPDVPEDTAVGGSIWGVTNRFVADKYRC